LGLREAHVMAAHHAGPATRACFARCGRRRRSRATSRRCSAWCATSAATCAR
jgi:hypothetical protein